MSKRQGERAGSRQPEDAAALIHKAFRRMAMWMANLVCGIWLVLMISMAIWDEQRPELGFFIIMLVVTAPLAYLIPYGLVRAIGLVVVAFKKPPR